jgi:hypothetical protein
LLDLAFYQEPYWSGEDSGFIKSLLLFFDGVALLTPGYMLERPFEADPSLAGPLADQGLLHLLSPEQLVDDSVTRSLADLFEGLLARQAFDDLERGGPFSEISASRLGLPISPDLMGPIVAALQERGLAAASEDGVSVPVHRAIRAFVLGTLSQLLREPAETLGYALQPVGGGTRRSSVPGLLRLLDLEPMPTSGRVVVSDLQQVAFDLSPVPLDEVLGFREEHGADYRAYARDLREFVRAVSVADSRERDEAFADRRDALADAANALNKHARTAWRRPMASFSLGIGGAAVGIATGNPVGAGIAFASGLLGLKRQAEPASVYSYLFAAEQAWPLRV